MINSKMTIRKNLKIAGDAYEMKLDISKGPEDAELIAGIRPGQFADVRIDGFFLRRPISICDWDPACGTLTIVYRTVGAGTRAMGAMKEGSQLDVLWPLGNGFNTDAITGRVVGSSGFRPILAGGGVGTPPMVGLCRKLISKGFDPYVVLGFRRKEDVMCLDMFEEMGAKATVMTEDGSFGEKGFVTDGISPLVNEGGAYAEDIMVFACGPEAMLKAVDSILPEQIPAQMSFEERMGCGFGACMGCSCKTKYGSKRICKDGPVLERREILW